MVLICHQLVELWKHKFSSQCLSIVHDQAFGARTPSYKVIQELDKKVRNFYTPTSLQVPGFGGPMGDLQPPPVALTMQRYTGFAIREICTLPCFLIVPRYSFVCSAFLLAPRIFRPRNRRQSRGPARQSICAFCTCGVQQCLRVCWLDQESFLSAACTD